MRFILLTGANRGLGRATAERLLQQGHRLLITARTPEKTEGALAELRAAVPEAEGRLEGRPLDLSRLDEVRAFAGALVDEERPVQVLLNSAGVMQQSETRRLTPDGYEETLAVNVIAPWLLTQRLLPLLEQQEAPRVINVSSRLHIPGARGQPPRFDFDDPFLDRGYDPDLAYKNSKLALVWATYELARRRPDLVVSAVCPGFVPTTAAESTHGLMRWFMKNVLSHMPFAESVEDASTNLAWTCTSDAVVSGKFYAEQHEMPSSDESYDEARAARLWSLLEDWTA